MSRAICKEQGILLGTIDPMSKYVTAPGPEWGTNDNCVYPPDFHTKRGCCTVSLKQKQKQLL